MIGISVTYTGFAASIRKGRRAARRELVAAITRVFERAMKHLHSTFLPRHFRKGAAAKYNYARRSPKYLARKKRQKGHTAPLVWTGRLRREARRYLGIQSLKTKPVTRGRLHLPKYAYYRRGAGKQYSAAELAAVSKDEAEFLRRMMERDVPRAVDAVRDRYKVTIA